MPVLGRWRWSSWSLVGLGQALVTLAGLVMGLLGLVALGLAGLTSQLLFGLLSLFGLIAGGLLGLVAWP